MFFLSYPPSSPTLYNPPFLCLPLCSLLFPPSSTPVKYNTNNNKRNIVLQNIHYPEHIIAVYSRDRNNTNSNNNSTTTTWMTY